jgi:integrase
MLDAFIGALHLDAISDDTLARFVHGRRTQGVAAKTIRLSLEKVRRILNKAARVWRENNQPWLRIQPPLLSMPRGRKRAPFPLSYAEERALLSRLPQPLADMCLLKVNTGLRADEVCGLRWAWEVPLEEGGSVFAIPPAAHKGGDYEHYRLVVLNSVAQRVIEAHRGKHEVFVFVSKRRKKPLSRLNNGPFHRAREAAGLRDCRVHDLKHTFGARLRAAGVALELRQVLLGHRNENITTHYSMPRLKELREAAERVVEVKDSPSVVRLIGGAVTSPTKSHRESKRPRLCGLKCLMYVARPAGFEPTTPWFVDCEPDFEGSSFSNLGATVRCPLHHNALHSPANLGTLVTKYSRIAIVEASRSGHHGLRNEGLRLC